MLRAGSRIQEIVELCVCIRCALVRLAGKEKVPVKVDVVLVRAPQVCKSERIKRMQEHQLAIEVIEAIANKAIAQIRNLDRRTKKPFHSVQATRDDYRPAWIACSDDCNIDCQLAMVLQTGLHHAFLETGASTRCGIAKHIARFLVIPRKRIRAAIGQLLVSSNGAREIYIRR